MKSRSLLAMIAALVLAESVAADCVDLQSCFAQAVAARIEDVRIGPDGVAACEARHGCVIANWGAGDKPEPLGGGGMSVAPTGNAVRPYVVAPGMNGARPAATRVPLPPEGLGFTPGTGGTIAVTYQYAPGYYELKDPVLFSLVQEQPNAAPRTIAALGIRDGRYQWGTAGPDVRPAGYWTPLWDPELPKEARQWVTLFITFRAAPGSGSTPWSGDGKVQIDGYFGSSRDFSSPAILRSSLIDAGWPLARYPVGRNSKPYLKANALYLGSPEDGALSAPIAVGFGGLATFRRPLTQGEKNAYFAKEMAAATLSSLNYDAAPCNSGNVLTDKPIQDAVVSTVCGLKLGPTVQLLVDRPPVAPPPVAPPPADPPLESYTFGTPWFDSVGVWQARFLGEQGFGRCERTNRGQRWQVTSRGGNNYVIWMALGSSGGSAITDSNGLLTLDLLSEVPPRRLVNPARLWHASLVDPASPATGMRFMSLASGKVIVVSADGAKLELQPMETQLRQTWLPVDCWNEGPALADPRSGSGGR